MCTQLNVNPFLSTLQIFPNMDYVTVLCLIYNLVSKTFTLDILRWQLLVGEGWLDTWQIRCHLWQSLWVLECWLGKRSNLKTSLWPLGNCNEQLSKFLKIYKLVFSLYQNFIFWIKHLEKYKYSIPCSITRWKITQYRFLFKGKYRKVCVLCVQNNPIKVNLGICGHYLLLIVCNLWHCWGRSVTFPGHDVSKK